jgi:hypothetical protein
MPEKLILLASPLFGVEGSAKLIIEYKNYRILRQRATHRCRAVDVGSVASLFISRRDIAVMSKVPELPHNPRNLK